MKTLLNQSMILVCTLHKFPINLDAIVQKLGYLGSINPQSSHNRRAFSLGYMHAVL